MSPVWLNGEWSGLRATDKDHAAAQLSGVLQRRGHLAATRAAVLKAIKFDRAHGAWACTWP